MALKVAGNFQNRRNQVKFNVSIFRFTDEGVFFYYSPSLDLTGYGKTDEEAKESFEETMNQFLDYSINKKTFFSELKKLGWKVSKAKSTPPSLVQMLTTNDYLASIFEEKTYEKFDREVSMPAFA